ncbi:carboxylesterase family protein [Streptosporangium minutum]|uniref:carboxylesterase family protein n=1 Tax=Streptosporangium minutum TaxID=569862 RepID=UPI0010545C84|nr:carboxylesterase family protein [Streptosporangium minutum]
MALHAALKAGINHLLANDNWLPPAATGYAAMLRQCKRGYADGKSGSDRRGHREAQEGLRRFFGDKAAAIAAEYPSRGRPVQAAAAILSDLDWAWAGRASDRMLSEHTPVYSYGFADRTAPPIFPLPGGVEPLASHGSELSFLFPGAALTREQRKLGDMMITYWSRFAATGDPNAPGLPRWSPVRTGHVHRLAPGPGGVGIYNQDALHKLTFWDRLAGVYRVPAEEAGPGAGA